MSVYMCNAVKHTLTDEARARIAKEITRIHVATTNECVESVHVFFFDDAPTAPLYGKRVFLFVNLRGRYQPEQKARLMSEIPQVIHEHAHISPNSVMISSAEMPIDWILDGRTMGGHALG